MPSQEELDSPNLDLYLGAISQKLNAAGSKGLSSLSETERRAIAAHIFACEVSNGGIEQFFVNPAGDDWRDTHAALKAFGPKRLTAMFEEALSIFPSGTPSEDHVTRCREYKQAGPEARKLLESLTDEYYDLQAESAENCLYAALGRLASQQLAKQAGA